MTRPFFPLPYFHPGALVLGAATLLPLAVRAQAPGASSYATRDGRIASYVLACASTNGTFTAAPCGVAGMPVHVTIDGGGVGSSVPATAAGTASAALVGVQGGGSGALPVLVSQGGGWTVSVGNLPATQPVSGTVAVSNLPGTQAVTGTVAVGNFPATQAVSAAALPLPAGAATAARQPALNTDGGGLVHVTNLPATQAVSATALPLPSGAATAAGQLPRTATITPSSISVSTSDTAVLAAGAATTRLDIFNVAGSGTIWLTPVGGSVTAASVGTGYPIPPGGGYSFPGTAVPANGFHAISSSGTNTVTVWAGN